MVQVQTTVIIILYFVIHCPLLHSPMIHLNINYMNFSINWTRNSALFEAFPDGSHTKTRIECVFKYSLAVFIYISTDVLWQSEFNLIQYNLQSPQIHIKHFTDDRPIVVCIDIIKKTLKLKLKLELPTTTAYLHWFTVSISVFVSLNSSIENERNARQMKQMKTRQEYEWNRKWIIKVSQFVKSLSHNTETEL